MFYVSSDQSLLQPEAVRRLLKQTYWAADRSDELIERSIRHSECFGVYLSSTDEQIGFARVVTDFTTIFYICDVIIDQAHRGMGAGKALIEAITSDDRFAYIRGFLATADAHGLYEKYDFHPVSERYMVREWRNRPEKTEEHL